MSSIYDALNKAQATDTGMSQGAEIATGGGRVPRMGFVLAAVLITFAVTSLVFLTLGGDKGREGLAVQAEESLPQAAPLSAPEMFLEAEALRKSGQAYEAIRAYEDVLKLTPDRVEAYLQLGGLYFSHGEYNQALITYTRALKYFRHDARVLNNTGSVLLAMGETERAIDYFHKALRDNADFVEPIYNLACAYAQKGDRPQALAYLERASAMHDAVRQWAAGDPDLESLEDEAAYRALIGRE